MGLKILSGGAANGLVTALTPAFTAATEMGITGDFGAVGIMRDRVVDGEPVDLIILSRTLIDKLADSGHVDPASIGDVGNVVTGVAVRDGRPVPDVSTVDGLRAVLLAADAIYVPDLTKSTAGIHVAGMFADLGIEDIIADRLKEYPNGQTALAAMAASDDANPVGSTQITEILNTKGVQYAGDLPKGYDLITTYTAGISTSAANAEAARKLIAILTAPEHADARARAGFSS
jgi:molybdate transport system substrate-binding protein